MGMKVTFKEPAADVPAMVSAAAELGIESAGKLLLDASQPLVPVATGEMKQSGKSEKAGPRTIRVSYTRTGEDGYNVAARQHEDMSLHHPGGGEAKFLERPMHSEGPAMLRTVGEAIRAVL